MRILPVIDIRNGVVVRGVAGEREAYRPVESRLTDSVGVVDVARALREAFGMNELYVADLDAILDDAPNSDLYRELARNAFQLTVDAGLRDATRAALLLESGVQTAVAGLETIPGPALLREFREQFGADRIVFSVDLQNGRPLIAANSQWPASGERQPAGDVDALTIAASAYDAGIRRMIVLDLAAVGVGNGIATLQLCREIRDRFPDVELTTGGGVRNVDDLRKLGNAGIDAVLIATALHNGSLTVDDLRRFE